MHARSYTDPLFQNQFKEVSKPEERRICLGCHAPLAIYDRDPQLTKATTREGVSCDFCHTVSALLPIAFDQPLRFVLAPGEVKRGPFSAGEMIEKGHKNERSSLFRDSAFCAGCHEVVNRLGLHVMSTFSEWSQSVYAAQRIACQNCHLPQDIRFPTVDPSTAVTPRSATSHSMLGGHSALQLRGAGMLALRAYVIGSVVDVSVDVTNVEAGHFLPTGLPSRKVVLKVGLFDEKEAMIQEKEIEYKRVLGDTQGRPIPSGKILDLFLNSSSVVSDTRIPPKETRQERIRFETSRFRRPRVAVATLEYRLEPGPPDRPFPPLRLAEQRMDLPLRPAAGRYYMLALFVLALAGALWFMARRRTEGSG